MRKSTRMKLVMLVLFLLFMIIAARMISRQMSGQPPIAMVKPNAQRVVTKEGQGEIKASYEIWNRGGQDLVLSNVSTTCGCTVASIEPKIVPPGGHATVVAVGSPPSAGEKLVSISIDSNKEPAGPIMLSLTMVSLAKPPFIADHSGPVRFGTIHRKGVISPQQIRIETYELPGREPWLQLSAVEPKTLMVHQVSVRVTSFVGVDYREYQFEALLPPLSEPGEIAGEIRFTASNEPRATALTLPVHGIVAPAVKASPSALLANVEPEDDSRWLTLMLQADDPDFCLNAEVESHLGELLEIRRSEARANQNTFKIRSRQPVRGPINGELVFKTNHPAMPRVVVPVVIRIIKSPVAEF